MNKHLADMSMSSSTKNNRPKVAGTTNKK